MKFKRDLVKYVRDKAKSGYIKDNDCYICGSTDKLDFHHFYGLTELLDTWLRTNNITIETEQFISENYDKVYNKTVTLCHQHHLRLHSIYGKRPKLITAEKQARWVELQREKHGMVR